MHQSSTRLLLTIGLAGIAGVLHGLGPGISLLANQPFLGIELTPPQIGPVISLVNLLSTIVTIGIFLGGYWWAQQATIPNDYGSFTVSLLIAAFIGHTIGFLPLFISLSPQPIIATLGVFGMLAVSLIAVPVPGLAGGALSQYRATR